MRGGVLPVHSGEGVDTTGWHGPPNSSPAFSVARQEHTCNASSEKKKFAQRGPLRGSLYCGGQEVSVDVLCSERKCSTVFAQAVNSLVHAQKTPNTFQWHHFEKLSFSRGWFPCSTWFLSPNPLLPQTAFRSHHPRYWFVVVTEALW